MLVQRHTELSAHVVAFSRFLRANGFPISPDREADALRSLALVGIATPSGFLLALRAVFPQNHKQLQAFDALYAQYWKELDKAVDSKIKNQEKESAAKKKKTKQDSEAAFEALKNWLHGNKNPSEAEELASYSIGESLIEKDFSTYTDDDLAESQQLIREMVRRISQTLSRRYRSFANGSQLDLRQILRKNFRKGDEIIDLFYRKPTRNKLRLVLLCDVSKSMDLYSRFFVQFMFAFQNLYRSIETFAFSTQLYRITEDLKEMDYPKALENLQTHVPNWSGGTDLGQALRTFAQHYALKTLSSRTVVFIISDGWDTGESDDLEHNIQLISRKSRSVFWLNPLAGNPNYQPQVKALQLILPHIDGLLPAHNLESLRLVVEQFQKKSHN
jgi:uncharacterized protein